MTLEWRETILFQIFQNQDPPSSSESVSYMLHSTTVGCYTGVKKRRGYDIGRHGFQTHMHFLMSALKKLRYISGEEKGKSVGRHLPHRPTSLDRIQFQVNFYQISKRTTLSWPFMFTLSHVRQLIKAYGKLPHKQILSPAQNS